MSRVTFNLAVANDGSHARVQISLDGKDVCWGDLEAPELDALIASLAQTRAGLADTVPVNLDPNSRLPAVPDPAYQVGQLSGTKCLDLRHPGLGWLRFVLPAEEAQKIAQALL